MYFDQLSGAAYSRKRVEIFFELISTFFVHFFVSRVGVLLLLLLLLLVLDCGMVMVEVVAALGC